MRRLMGVTVAILAGAFGLMASLYVASSFTRPLSSAQDPFLADPSASAESANGQPVTSPPSVPPGSVPVGTTEPPPPPPPPGVGQTAPSQGFTPPPPSPPPVPTAQPVQQAPPGPPPLPHSVPPDLSTPGMAPGGGQVTADENLTGTLQSIMEPFIYRTDNRRDPFEPFRDSGSGLPGVVGPTLPLQRYDLDEVRLIGIIWNVRNPKAMFQDPHKRIHILGKDDRIGRNSGYIAVIREGEVVVVETVSVRGELGYSTRVLKLIR